MIFLETITAFGYEVLVPISRIRFIYITNKENWEIHICGINEEEWVECFSMKEEDKMTKRFNQIKKLLGIKDRVI
jgi:hypothetical protein